MATGQKFDTDKTKVRWDCLPWEVVEGIAKAMTYGAEKYNENPDDPNWVKVEGGKNRYFAAGMRHFMQDRAGIILDADALKHGHKVEHLDMMMFNFLAYAKFKREERK